MIAYDLQCGNGHTFEGWFEDSAAFDEQKEKGLLSCPICNDMAVCRIPSTFAIKSSASGPEPSASPARLEEASKKISEFLENNFENVGTDFATEALKIHYGVGKARNIRGVSTQQEEKMLKDEGIAFFKFPAPTRSEGDS